MEPGDKQRAMNVSQYPIIEKVNHDELKPGYGWWQLHIINGIIERDDMLDGSFEGIQFIAQLGHCLY